MNNLYDLFYPPYLEAYYNAKLFDNVWLSADYEFVHNPGYNRDRSGPVHIFGVRGHVEF